MGSTRKQQIKEEDQQPTIINDNGTIRTNDKLKRGIITIKGNASIMIDGEKI
jgi:hypothetical protein